jgi:hypothetical protein
MIKDKENHFETLTTRSVGPPPGFLRDLNLPMDEAIVMGLPQFKKQQPDQKPASAHQSGFSQNLLANLGLVGHSGNLLGSHGQPQSAGNLLGGHGQPQPAGNLLGSHGQPHQAGNLLGSHGQPQPAGKLLGSHGQPQPAGNLSGSHGLPHPAGNLSGSHGLPQPAGNLSGSHGQPLSSKPSLPNPNLPVNPVGGFEPAYPANPLPGFHSAPIGASNPIGFRPFDPLGSRPSPFPVMSGPPSAFNPFTAFGPIGPGLALPKSGSPASDSPAGHLGGSINSPFGVSLP